jgi:predicted DsbA family dithiol-disulfide isomerase
MTISSPQQPTAETPAEKKLQIDVWSDLACPWCYIGKHRLDQAIASSPHAEAITIRVRSYELDPDMSDQATPNLELLAAKYGLSPAQAEQMEDKVAAIAIRTDCPSQTECWPTASTSTESCTWRAAPESQTSCSAFFSGRCSVARPTSMTTPC